jgi:hypothetical protein
MKTNPQVHPLIMKSICVLFLASAIGFAQSPPRALLNSLRGSWLMTGNVRNKPVQYNAEGTWILQNQFLSFHMKDTASSPTYEANLYIGIDSSKNQFVAHWLDLFGGAGARVVALGPLSPEAIEIVYPYAEGRFRNQFKYDRRKDEWTLVIESEDATGRWSRFAQYTISRR